MSSSPALSDLTRQLVAAATRAGAQAAEAVAVRSDQISIDVREGRLEEAQSAESLDLTLRVYVGQRQASVASSDARGATLAAMAERAVAMAREAPEDPFCGLADPAQLATLRDCASLDLVDPDPFPSPSVLEDTARRGESAAQAVQGVTQVGSAGAGATRRTVWMTATNGFDAGSSRTEHGHSVTAISGTGTTMQRDWDHDSRVHRSDLRSIEEIGRRAGERAAAMAGAVRPPTGTYPVLYDERVAGSLFGHLMSAMNGAAVARGQSWLLGRLGTQVLPQGLSLTEEPHRPRMPGSRLWDGEGLSTVRRDWIDMGRLTGWTLDLASARKLGLPPTGNSQRGGGPAVTNLRLTPGGASRDDLLAEMQEGLLITSLIGSTINPNTGDYSRGASGFWVTGGRISHPVHECTVADSLPAMLSRIIPANDGREDRGWVIPSILIPGMMIAGA